jgi:hypothetical protein
MSEAIDMTPFIQPKSDQLNADSLIGGPITVQILAVQASKADAEKPVSIAISGGHMPFRPSKTDIRILVALWGKNGAEWVGKWLTLARDPTVKWGGVEVGGVRVQAASHIDKPASLTVTVSRGVKKIVKIGVIKPDATREKGAPTANLDALLTDAKLAREDVDRWLAAEGKPGLASRDEAKVAALAGWLAADPKRLDAIRALVPTTREPGDESDVEGL